MKDTFLGLPLNIHTFKDGALLAKRAQELASDVVCEGVRWQNLDADLLDDYVNEFGQYGTRVSVGGMDLLEIRMNIARNPQYTDRCREHPLFQDCFDENGELYEED